MRPILPRPALLMCVSYGYGFWPERTENGGGRGFISAAPLRALPVAPFAVDTEEGNIIFVPPGQQP